MKKIGIVKSAIIAALTVAMVCAMVPAVSAASHTVVKFDAYGLGSYCAAGVSGDLSGGQYYNCAWHVGRYLGSADTYSGALNYAKYYNGACILSGSTNSNNWDSSASGPYASIGASGYQFFYDSSVGYYSCGTGQVWLPW